MYQDPNKQNMAYSMRIYPTKDVDNGYRSHTSNFGALSYEAPHDKVVGHGL